MSATYKSRAQVLQGTRGTTRAREGSRKAPATVSGRKKKVYCLSHLLFRRSCSFDLVSREKVKGPREEVPDVTFLGRALYWQVLSHEPRCCGKDTSPEMIELPDCGYGVCR